MSTSPRHVVFGTGAIGLAAFEALRRRGERVRLVNRSGTASVPDDVEVIGGDASDPGFAAAAAKGAQVVYQTLNPPYHQWVELFPALQASVLAAAQASGARLVSMENVYMYGRPNGQPLTETRPYAAHTKKGTLRARMARELLAAHAAGRVQVAIGRASDYFGPRGGAQSMLGDRVISAALNGKTATVLGDPDQPHTYTYIPDIGEGLAVLGEHPDAPGEVWHLPNDPDTRTTRQLVDSIYRQAGQPAPSSAAPRHSCCEPSASSTPPSGNWSSCSTSSRNPSSSTAARSRPSWMSTPPHWTKPWPTPWPPTAPTQHRKPPGLRRALRRIGRPRLWADPLPDRGGTNMDAPRATTSGRVTAGAVDDGPETATDRETTMQAIVQDRYGSADVLELREIDRPAPKDNEVLIRVHAAGLHRGDWHVMTGLPYLIRFVVPDLGLRKPKVAVRGMDVAGTVAAVGEHVTRFQPGDAVFGWCDGSFAEYACAPEDNLALKPTTLSFEQAAVVPISGFAALQGLRDQGQVQPGQQVLIIGAAGGVGVFAVQLAKAFGAQVTGVCSTTQVELVRSIGADDVIDYTRDDVTDGTRHWDLILDTAGRRSLSQLRRALTPRGTLVIVGGEGAGRWMGGFTRNLRAPLLSRFVGQRLRMLASKPRHEDLQTLRELSEAGKLTPVIDRTYPLREVPEAIRQLEAGHTRGKIVITV